MTDPNKDDEMLPARMLDAARAHHEPPAPPTEAIWQRIRSDRTERRGGAAAGDFPAWRRPQVWVPLAIAATLVVGFGLGRLWPQIHSGVRTPVATADPAPKGEDRFTRYAAQQTLGQAEVLLTQYRSDARTGTPAATTPAEARQLLLATRLLLDSPTLTDQRLRGLLEDLELVLAQIAEGSDQKEDRAVITEGLDRRDVLPRLRAAAPVATGVQIPGAI